VTTRAGSAVILGVLLLPSIAFCQSGPSLVLKNLLKERIEAISRKDTGALDRICARNYQFINSAGEKMAIAELKKEVMEAETPVKLSTILSYQPFITEDESMAFATFEIEEEIAGDSRNITKNDLIVTEIYIKEHARWKTLLTHTSQKICLLPN
jgi:hypothetical protein